MAQYQVTTVLHSEEELERFVLGQRLARDEERRLAWEKHYCEAERKLEQLKAEIERLAQGKQTLEKRYSREEQDLKRPPEQKTEASTSSPATTIQP